MVPATRCTAAPWPRGGLDEPARGCHRGAPLSPAAGRLPVSGEGDSGVLGGRGRQRRGAEVTRHRHRHRHPPILERPGGVDRLVLDPNPGSCRDQRCPPSPRVTGSASGSTSRYRYIHCARCSSTAGSTGSMPYSQSSGEPQLSQVPRSPLAGCRAEHDEQIKEGIGAHRTCGAGLLRRE